MKTASSKTHRVSRKLPALLAVGSCMAVLPASALELGDLIVQSSIGKPLRASIAFALAPHEQLNRHCVYLRPGPTASGLPGIGRATLSIANGLISLAGTTPVREPMLATQIVIDCPYTAKFSREYMLFVDPPSSAANAAFVPAAPTAEWTSTPVVANRPTYSRVDRDPIPDSIPNSTRYQVKRGDSLSGIVARIENRTMTMWPAVDSIFRTNPDAFIDNDPNKLKAGSWLTIPDLGGNDPVVVRGAAPASTRAAPTRTAEAVPTFSDAASVMVEGAARTEVYEPVIYDPVITVVEPVTETDAGATADIEFEVVDLTDFAPAVEDLARVTTDDLRPGDVILDDTLFVESAITPTGNEVSAGIQTETADSGSGLPAWFMWLAGGGVAFIVALLMFGRRLRGLFGSEPEAPVLARPERRSTNYDTSGTSEIEVTIIEPVSEDGIDMLDDMPTSENLVLDADLIDGTGLEEGTDMDVAQDFGFAATSVLDVELPFEAEANSINQKNPLLPATTEILPLVDEPTILENEVLPEEDDYDMSVIMDATKMPQPEDATEFDLKAVEVDPGDETMTTQSADYTLSEEGDYKIIEQDYEDEMSATQLLNKEIADAALKLTDDADEVTDDEVTSEMPLATVTDLEVTAQLQKADKKADKDAGATDITAEMRAKTGESG